MSENSPEQQDNSNGTSKLARVAAGVALAASIGISGAADAAPPQPQRPPAAVAEAFPQQESTKTEIVGEIPGTGEHTGGRISYGFERDTNGTLNTGKDGEERGVPLRELIPDIMPNTVIGSSDGHGGTTGDGWLWENARTTKKIEVPLPVEVPGELVETTTEVVDQSKYPIKTPWEQDFHASPELAQELRGAAEDCYTQIEARQRQGYLLIGVEVGGLASDEDNATRPGDPMAGLGEQSELNKNLANERGLAGMQTMSEVLQSHGVDPAILSFLDGQEVQASPQEIDQILQYSKILGQDPLEVIQDFNRARSEGLQPLMDNLFVGNRGIVCIASFTKLETSMIPGPDQTKIMMVPVEVNGEKRIWRIEIPGEILLLPLLYFASKLAVSASGGIGLTPRPNTTPGGYGPDPLKPKPLVPATKRTQKPVGPRYKTPIYVPPSHTPEDFFGPNYKKPPKVGKGQAGHKSTAHPRKQPRPHNMSGGWKPGKQDRRNGVLRDGR